MNLHSSTELLWLWAEPHANISIMVTDKAHLYIRAKVSRICILKGHIYRAKRSIAYKMMLHPEAKR